VLNKKGVSGVEDFGLKISPSKKGFKDYCPQNTMTLMYYKLISMTLLLDFWLCALLGFFV